jgi:hypothetical protein
MTENRQVWVGLCPHCGYQGLVLGMKHKETDPIVLYCPECRKNCTLLEIRFTRL